MNDACRACDRRAAVCEVCGLCEDCHDHQMQVRFTSRRMDPDREEETTR